MAKTVAVGVCPNCGTEFVRPSSCSHAACDCKSSTLVPLEPAIILPPRYLKKLETVSKHSDIPIDKLTDALLKEASKAVLRGLAIGQDVAEGRIETVSLQFYEQECRSCLYREKTLTPYNDYLSRVETIKVKCAASSRCQKMKEKKLET